MKKGTTSLLLVLFVIACLAVSCKDEQPTPPHEHTYEANWQDLDDTYHVKKATCEHKDEELKEEHKWNEGVVTKPATTTEVGERTFTCTECDHTRTEEIPMRPAIQFAEGYSIDKTYDKTEISINKSKIIRTETNAPIDENEIDSILFKVKDAGDETYTEEAPFNAGDYTVKVTIKATPEHAKIELTKDVTISKKQLTGKITASQVLTYNGTTQLMNDITLKKENNVGVVSDDEVKITGVESGINAGESVPVTNKGTIDNSNYILSDSFNIVGKIKPRMINSKITTSRDYNGKPEMSYDKWNNISEVIAGDKNNLVLHITMSDKNAGTTKISSTEFKLNGETTNNYALPSDFKNIEAKINQKKLTLKGGKVEIQYSGDSILTLAGTNEVDGFVHDEFSKIVVTMSGKDVGATVSSYRIIDRDGKEDSNYFIEENDIKGKVSIVKKVLKLFPISKGDNAFATMYLPSSTGTTSSPMKERKVYLDGVKNEKVYVAISHPNDSKWTSYTSGLLDSYSKELSDSKNYMLQNVGDLNFKIVYGSVSSITIGSAINIMRPTQEGGATFIYKFTPETGKTYKAVLSNMSDPESITVIGVINEKGVQYYCSQYNSCKFTAEDNSEHYIFFHVKEGGTCQVIINEVTAGS